MSAEKEIHPTMERVFAATKLTPSEIALAVNESNQTITNWTKRGISKNGAIKIALKFKLNLDWILNNEGTSGLGNGGFINSSPKTINNAPLGRWVPVKAYSTMGMDGYFTDMGYEGNGGDGYVPSLTASANAYAIKGNGQSMYPAVRHGWFLVCDPDATPTPTEFVQVTFKNGKNTIKELIGIISGVLHLLSVNGNERYSFEMDTVEQVVAVTDIVPPSRHIQDYPLMPIKDIVLS